MSKKQNTKKVEPIPRGMYAWNYTHAGSFLVYVESLKDCYEFVFLPGPSEYYLTQEDFKKAMATNLLEFVDVLPKEIYDETLALSYPTKKSKLCTNEIQ